MPTKLDNILTSIDPDRNLNDIASRVGDALNSYRLENGLVSDWDEFKMVLSKFCRHVECAVLGIPHSTLFDMDMYWGRCCRLFMKEYGSSGEKTAFEIARTGTEGGFSSLLKLIAKRMGEEYAQREIAARVGCFYGSLDVDEKLAVCDEYLQKYGHLLPSELTEGSAARIKANFLKVLEEHPRLILRLRRVGRG
jgi:hypothetical protein